MVFRIIVAGFPQSGSTVAFQTCFYCNLIYFKILLIESFKDASELNREIVLFLKPSRISFTFDICFLELKKIGNSYSSNGA